MTRKQKKMLCRIVISGVLLIGAALMPVEGLWRLPLFLIPYGVVGWDVLWKALRNIAHGHALDENFLMTIATIGALVLGEYAEAVGVMLFYQVGELFQSYAVGKSRRSIARLMDIRPDSARVEREGEWTVVDPDEVCVGEIIEVHPGEKIALDGVVIEGSSALDTAALTGESVPRSVAQGQEVLSGCVNLTGVLRLRVTKPFGESTVSKILDLVENASARKARSEQFITRFAKVYTPAVVGCAVALAVLPSLITGQWAVWVARALTFLVISCPCALVISVPLSFFGGIGGASMKGVLVKGGNYLEQLAKMDTAVFDKTGTLTRGCFEVTAICPQEGVTGEQLLEFAALAEQNSNHPIAISLRSACKSDLSGEKLTEVTEIAGHGVTVCAEGHTISAGNAKLMAMGGIEAAVPPEVGTAVHVALDDRYLGYILISDVVKETAPAAIRALKERGVHTVMLTGDTRSVGEAVGAQLGMDEVHTQLLPGDKVDRVETLLNGRQPGGVLVFVGDGVNDAPVLSRADVGIAMGALGSDAAIEAADIVLMDDDPAKLIAAMDIARKCLRIVGQNIVLALGVKALVLILGALGAASMWAAVFADVGVAVLAILNAMRMLRVK